MSRPLRLEFADALCHVTSRGDRREDIYHDDADRQAWLTVLAQVCKRFNWSVQAHCMMDNHYHLLVQTPDANLSAGMRHLEDNYLLELARYVALNPVRAGVVQEAKDWP